MKAIIAYNSDGTSVTVIRKWGKLYQIVPGYGIVPLVKKEMPE